MGLVVDDQGYGRRECVPDVCSARRESDDASGNLNLWIRRCGGYYGNFQ